MKTCNRIIVMYLFISLFSCVDFPFPRQNFEWRKQLLRDSETTRMKEDKEERKEEGENESFIGALIAKFRERDDSGDDERDAFTIEQEEDAFSKTTKTLTQKRTDGTNATKKKKKNEKENVKAMIDRSFWWREDEETENEDDRRSHHRLSHQPHTDRQNHPLNHQNWEEEEEKEEEKQRKRSLSFVDAAAGFAEKEEEEDADVDILEVWRRRRRENELMNTTTTTDLGGGGGARTTSSFYDTSTNQYRRGGSFNDDNGAMMFSHHRHRSNDDANKVVDMVTNKSAQTSFFREDPFVSVGTRKEERGRGKRRKGRSAKSEPTIAKSKNGRVLISAANITDESDEDFSDDANTTATSSVEYDSKEEEEDDDDDDNDDDEIDEEQIRLEKRLDAIKARLKKFGIS